ncbi:MAG: hypothetical protein HYX78_15765 [Armatimonadetes bacterium]|nr:hypothetical protein [Armatimonadota bacterium]
MRPRKNLLTAIVFAAAICFASAALGVPFNVTVVPGSESSTWVYTIFNNDTTGDVIPLALDIEWDEGQAPDSYTVVGSPQGWEPNDSFDWPAWDAVDTFEPSAGKSLSGFVLSAPTPGLNYTVSYLEVADMKMDSGRVQIIPEPAALHTVLSGLVAGFGILLRRRC